MILTKDLFLYLLTVNLDLNLDKIHSVTDEALENVTKWRDGDEVQILQSKLRFRIRFYHL